MNNVNLMVGDCLERMRDMADNSVDSIVTDPPYEIGFMAAKWDSTGIANSVEMWKEALRVLKPGGHMLAFSGSRTYHRMTCAIEDAGFEVRDQIMWVYGSGFPKSLDVSKAIDKAAGAEREVIGKRQFADGSFARDGAVLGQHGTFGSAAGCPVVTAPATKSAQQWQGWGTALKPAHEPICVARKPLAKGNTVAANVLKWGTGALNIDASRVGTETRTNASKPAVERNGFIDGFVSGTASKTHNHGRWAANLIHDGSDEVVELFPDAKGQQGKLTGNEPSAKTSVVYGEFNSRASSTPRIEDSKSAARFFYCAKSSKKDRGDGNSHPTVKPTDLMRYLIRLVTPPNGVVLDPFMGSGSTGKAAVAEGFNFIGIDMDEAYVSIAKARISVALESQVAKV